MQGKHPVTLLDRSLPSVSSAAPLWASDSGVLAGLRSFVPGALGGLDGLRLQHLLDLMEDSSESSLLAVLTEFANLVLVGGPFSFGSRLFTLSKPGEEASAHSRAYLEACLRDSGILKLGFKNAFNCIR